MSDDKIVDFPGATRLDLDPARVLERASETKFREVVIVGLLEDGEEYFASSMADAAGTLWHLCRAQYMLMRIVDDSADE